MRYIYTDEGLYGEDYGDIQAPSFLGAKEHAHAVDTRHSFLRPFSPPTRGPGDELLDLLFLEACLDSPQD